MEERREFIEQISALREREWSPNIDYSRSNGLFEQINRTMVELEDEEQLRLQMELTPPPEHRPSEPISTESFEALAAEGYVEITPQGERPVVDAVPATVSPAMQPPPTVVY